MITDKVRPHHLERKALLYVRQSSAHQCPPSALIGQNGWIEEGRVSGSS